MIRIFNFCNILHSGTLDLSSSSTKLTAVHGQNILVVSRHDLDRPPTKELSMESVIYLSIYLSIFLSTLVDRTSLCMFHHLASSKRKIRVESLKYWRFLQMNFLLSAGILYQNSLSEDVGHWITVIFQVQCLPELKLYLLDCSSQLIRSSIFESRLSQLEMNNRLRLPKLVLVRSVLPLPLLLKEFGNYSFIYLILIPSDQWT